MDDEPGIRTLRRRHFLRAAGGTLLALPFLPSLMRSPAGAQEPAHPKCFVGVSSANGGIWFDDMFPAATTLTESRSYAGRTIRRGDLVPTVAGGIASLSRVLSAPSGILTSSLAAKMNVIAGFDVTHYIAHHQGGNLGNYDSSLNVRDPSAALPTIDQVMAYSPSFYTSPVPRRSMELGFQPLSYNWSNPVARTGTIGPISPTLDTHRLFDELIVTDSGMPDPEPVDPRVPVVDRVYESYRRLRDGSRRLSSSDRRRLDEHLTRVQELQAGQPRSGWSTVAWSPGRPTTPATSIIETTRLR